MHSWYLRCLLALIAAALPSVARGLELHCVSLQYPPLIQQEDGGRVSGFAIDLVRTLFQRLGDNVIVEILPWARSLAMAYGGKTDCIFTLYRSEERERFLDYGQIPLYPQTVYFYARRGTFIEFDGTLASVAPYTIGAAHSVNYGQKFEAARGRLRIDASPSIHANFLKLAMGRVDLVPSDEAIANATLAEPAFREYAGQIVRLPLPLESIPSYIAFPRTRHLATERRNFDAALARFIANGEYETLLRRYGLQPRPAAKPPPK